MNLEERRPSAEARDDQDDQDDGDDGVVQKCGGMTEPQFALNRIARQMRDIALKNPLPSHSEIGLFEWYIRARRLYGGDSSFDVQAARKSVAAATAAAQIRSPAQQTLRYQIHPPVHPPGEVTSPSAFSSYPATPSYTSPGDSSCNILPVQPEDAHLRQQRVPFRTHPEPNFTSTFIPVPATEVIFHECCNVFEQKHAHSPPHFTTCRPPPPNLESLGVSFPSGNIGQSEKRRLCKPSVRQPSKMAFTKSQRIAILLAIDTVFFFVELIAGYAVHSLALVADSFHMLNDVLSLCVGLWAVKRAKTGRTSNFTYGWQRAETIGALVNGVFLVALCLSIFLDAIQRFVEPQIVTNPKLVLIVGCFGLASNILGLFLFHDHGHSHVGGHSHGHDSVKNAEEGHSHSHSHSHTGEHVQWADETTRLMDDQGGSIEDALPQVRVAGFKGTTEQRSERNTFNKSDESNTTAASGEASYTSNRRKNSTADNRHRRRASFFTGSIDDMPIHPAGRRDEIIQAGHHDEDNSDTNTDDATESNGDLSTRNANSKPSGYGSIQAPSSPEYSHAAHKHRQPKEANSGGGGHGHSHGDLNMRGVFLHVLGDALGNVGVIATALIIWLAKFPQRYYFDPAISLVITLIILSSAIPLCTAAARILLQAVPMGMSIDEIRADIEDLKGIKSAHHIHVWQLSDTKLVASLHVRISSDVKNAGTEAYMRLAKEIQQCLREYGIRSSTIQPEFETDAEAEHHHDEIERNGVKSPHLAPGVSLTKTASLRSNGTDSKVCMLDCEDAGEIVEQDEDDHDHDHEHDHDHDHGNSNGKHKAHDHQH